MTTERDRLAEFVFYLIRDHMPIGALAEVISKLSDDEKLYSNKHLEDLCNDYARRILEG